MVKVEHLVVDSGGFLKSADIQNLGENIYTVREVVLEIKDKATRQKLSFLPYQINFRQPSPSSIQRITSAAKQTGDYSSLSAVDIQVLALHYDLAQRFDPENVQTNITLKQNSYQFGASDSLGKESLPGFYMPDKSDSLSGDEIEDVAEDVEELDMNSKDVDENDVSEVSDEAKLEKSVEDIDQEGWITPGNIKSLESESDNIEKSPSKVACLTTDFAMQNVLMKLNLDVISIKGMRITSVRMYVLRCYACFHVTKIMAKVFCPKCGNKTLKRVPTTIEPDGTVRYYLSRNPKVLNPREKKFSLPMPKGGKHARNPVLCEDQPIPHNRVSKKALQKTNVWSDDYAIDGNPFATIETESRAFKLGIRQGFHPPGRRPRNPNAVGKKYGSKR